MSNQEEKKEDKKANESKPAVELLKLDQEDLVERVQELLEEKEVLTEELFAAKENPETLKRFNGTFKVGNTEFQFKQGIFQVHVPARILKDKSKAGLLAVKDIFKD